jgi:branched-chain amino acid transport system permease protein
MMFLDVLLSGLVFGAFYVTMAIGLTLIFGLLKIVNFAHGEFFMVGGFTYVLVWNSLDLSPWIALPVAMLAGALLGYLTERLLMRPMYAKMSNWRRMNDEYAIIVTFGLSLFLVATVNKVVGPWSLRGPELIDAAPVVIGGLRISAHRLVALAVATVVIGATLVFLYYSLWGKQIRAVSQNRFFASIMGVDVGRVSALVFVCSGALAALSGALLSPIVNPSPDVGMFPALKSYVIVVLGGLGSPIGAVAGGLILGVLESMGGYYVSMEYRETFGLALLVVVLLFRPSGLFGEVQRQA